MNRTISTTILIASLVMMVTGAVAQDEPQTARISLNGGRLLIGTVMPENADAGLLLGGAVNMGTIWKPWMHLTIGATHWSTDIDAAAFGGRSGSLSDTHIFTNVGLEFWEMSGIQGYLDLGLASHFLDAKIPSDPHLATLLGGMKLGAEAAYGISSTAGSFRISAEVRRELVNDASNWSFALGVGTEWGEGR